MDIWILSIEIKDHKILNGQYTTLYHSPSSSDADFIENLNKWIEKNHNEYKKHVICGDFYIDMGETSNKKVYKNKLNCMINENRMKQIVKHYTRVTENTKTLIDLVITNANDIKYEMSDDDKISDHSTIDILWNNACNETEQLEKRTILHKYNKQKDFYYYYDKSINCSTEAKKLIESLRESVDIFKKHIKIKNKNNSKWFDKNLKEMKVKRDEAYKNALNTENKDLWNLYK